MKYTEMQLGKIYFSNHSNFSWLIRFNGVAKDSIKTINYMRKDRSEGSEINYYANHNGNWE